jgi:ubiquinone/menaquinone biosynthesis C-methylase UbiE
MKKWSGERLETFVTSETTVEHLHRYAIACELSENKVVVDVACGEGYGSNLISKVAKKVIGVDIDGASIKKAIKKYKSPNLSFCKGPVQKIPLADSIADVVVSFETIEHLVDHDTMLSEIKRILKPDGILIISTPDKKYYSDETGYKNLFHKKELYKEEFHSLLEKKFHNISIFNQYSGSIFSIIPENKTSPIVYKGDYNSITKTKSVNYKFLIALATDKNIPVLSESHYHYGDILYKAGANNIICSTTYKVGHFLLYPLKLLKTVYHKISK